MGDRSDSDSDAGSLGGLFDDQPASPAAGGTDPGSPTKPADPTPTRSRRQRRKADRKARRDQQRRARHPILRALVITLEVAVIVLFFAVVAGVWIVIHAVDASSKLSDVRHDVNRVRADLLNGQDATADLRATQRDAHAANHDTHDPVWFAASWLSPVKTVRGLSAVADDLAQHALPPVVQVGPTVTPAKLRISRNQIALPPLQAAAPILARADTATQRARDRVASLPDSWIGVIGDARRKVLGQLTSLSGSVDDAARFTRVGPDMLGGTGTRRYFVGVQNNAEARATGGLVAAYAIVTADDGKIKVVQRGNDSKLFNARRPVTTPDAGYDAIYGNYLPTRQWITSNLSPNFPNAARIWAGLWQAQSGQHIDGAFGVDPYALGALVDATAPVKVSSYPTAFTGASLPAFIEKGEYDVFQGADQGPRKDFVSKVAGATLHNLLSGAGRPAAIATALGHSAGAGHLSLWSSRPEEQAAIGGTPLAGELARTAAPYASLSINNASGSKLDYYLDRSLDYHARSCSDERDATITIKLRNSAPAHGLPAYVRQATNPAYQNYVEAVPRQTVLAYIHTTQDARLTSFTLDGRVRQVTSGIEQGHPVYGIKLVLDPGQTRTIEVRVVEPGPTGAPQTRVQPMARPQQTRLDAPTCT